MTEPKADTALKDVAEGLKAILERIADFFDIFDLSFLVSGATTLAALRFLAWRANAEIPSFQSGWVFVIGLFIVCYVLGLACFAVGRWARMGGKWRRSEQTFRNWFTVILAGHGLDTEQPFADYLARVEYRGEWRLFVRLWAEVRNSPTLAPSFSLLRRYWVMAATCDGLAISLLMWAVVLFLCGFSPLGIRPLPKWVAFAGGAISIFLAFAVSREAGRYVDYQVEELVASIAAKRAVQ